MIELTTPTAIMIYLCLTLGILLGLWGYHHYKSRYRKILSTEQELFVCEYCHFVYLDDIVKEITKCPQCQSFNKRNTTASS
jgi:ribosomal protein L37AE/L43A